MKIVSVVGARPNFMKIAPLLRAITEHNKRNKRNKLNKLSITPILVHTGQHYDYEMSQIFFKDLDLPKPDIYLGVGSGTHAEQTGKVMIELEKVLLKEKPDLVVVVGDVNSTLAGALAAVKLWIPVAHVEAGPRMFDKDIPEEVNRVLTDHVSSFLFAPTQTAVDNLKREGINNGVYLTGDVMLDSFLQFSQIAEENSKILHKLDLGKGEYLLATVHRARNTDNKENLRSIIEAFQSTEEKIVFPVHPRTRKMLKQFGLLDQSPTISHQSLITNQQSPITHHQLLLIDPVGYLDSIMLTRNAKKVLTDSGGLQKEAYFSKVPCITLDEVTGWPETVEDGWNTLVGSNKDKIVEAVHHFEPEGRQRQVFGDGRAVERIMDVLVKDSPKRHVKGAAQC
jgi:UDP-N-acetylglucosamine 2-epimerase